MVTSNIYKRGVQERSKGLLKGTDGRKKDDESTAPQTIDYKIDIVRGGFFSAPRVHTKGRPAFAKARGRDCRSCVLDNLSSTPYQRLHWTAHLIAKIKVNEGVPQVSP